jgi:primosomal protein N' (replication factor Y)
MARMFPDIKCLRMDADATRGKHGHAKILNAFRRGEAQALIGTQMIAKGLDFPNVALVGVVAADISLFTGDFRAGEHTFQLLTQVSGRAGRAEAEGTVFIQTYNPEHYGVRFAKKGDYESFYAHEIMLRQAMNYPPYTNVFMVMFSGVDEKNVIISLHKLLEIMNYCNKKGLFKTLGPAPAFVSKINGQFRRRLLVKGEDEGLLRRFVLYCVKKLEDNDLLTGIYVNLTMNPAYME